MATDTLDCTGEAYSVQFHVGSDGISDYILFDAKGQVGSGYRHDLVVKKFVWLDSSGGYARNSMAVRTKPGRQPAFDLYVKGRQGRLVVDKQVVPVVCDWER